MCSTENWHGLSNLWGNWHNFAKKKKKEAAKPLVNWILHNGINLVDCHINCAAECKLITTSVWFKRMKEREEKGRKGISFPCLSRLSFFLHPVPGVPGVATANNASMHLQWILQWPSFPPPIKKKSTAFPESCKTAFKECYNYTHLLRI